MSLLKKWFLGLVGDDSEEEQEKQDEPAAAAPPPPKGFSNPIPPASPEHLRELIIKAFETKGWNFTEDSEAKCFSFDGTFDCDLKDYRLKVTYSLTGIEISAIVPLSIPAENMPAMYELVARINNRYNRAFFNFCSENGLIYSTFLVNNGESTTAKEIIESVLDVINALEGYGNAIVKTANGIGTPERNEYKAAEILFS